MFASVNIGKMISLIYGNSDSDPIRLASLCSIVQNHKFAYI